MPLSNLQLAFDYHEKTFDQPCFVAGLFLPLLYFTVHSGIVPFHAYVFRVRG
jgi:hypothetical protein